MPKIVDYAARFEFLREAAFAIVLDDGPATLSRQTLADVLGMSMTTVRRMLAPEASLPGLAAQAVEKRRMHGRWGLPRGDDHRANALRLLRTILPTTDERVDEELVWLRVVALHPRPTPTTAKGAARAAYQLFDRDWADPPTAPLPPRDDPSVARAVADREAFLRLRLARVLDELEVAPGQRPVALPLLRTFVDGLIWGVALGHLTPTEAGEQVEVVVDLLSRVKE